MIEAKKSWWAVEDLGGGCLRVVPFYDAEPFFRASYYGTTKEDAVEHYIREQKAYIKRQVREIKRTRRQIVSAKKLLEDNK
jgi:hypothetical protein